MLNVRPASARTSLLVCMLTSRVVARAISSAIMEALPISCVLVALSLTTLGSNGKCDMTASAIAAAESMHTYWNVPYSSIELTPMIGGNDTPSNIFTLADTSSLSQYALSKGLGGMHFWSLDRDTDCPSGSASATCNSYGTAGVLGFSNAFISALGQPVVPLLSPSPNINPIPSPSSSE